MSAGAEKADLWVPIRPGSDAAAALAMANVLVHELDLIDRDFLVERTNAPALVDPKTQRDAACIPEYERRRCAWDCAPTTLAKPYDECAQSRAGGRRFEVERRCLHARRLAPCRDHVALYT